MKGPPKKQGVQCAVSEIMSICLLLLCFGACTEQDLCGKRTLQGEVGSKDLSFGCDHGFVVQ